MSIIVYCDKCGAAIETTPSKANDRKHFFCTEECKAAAIAAGEYKQWSASTGELTDKEREKLARVYGVTVDQLERIRALGLNVWRVRAMVEGGISVRHATHSVGLQRPGGRMLG
mgnify:CR=1 FL=1